MSKALLPWSSRSEIRYAALLIGLVQILWSAIGLIPNGSSLFSRALQDAGLGAEWFATMFLAGVVLIAGAILPWRSGRHIGLFLASLVWLVMAGVFLSADLITPVTITTPLFGVFPLLLLYADVKRKPRRPS